MRTTAILHKKGGVGKTVTAINMASILAKDHHKRVLLIDADDQHNASDFFGADPDAPGLADYLRGTANPYYPENLSCTDIPGLWLLPSCNQLMDFDLSAIRHGMTNGMVLVDLFAAIAEDIAEDGRGTFDHIIVDCPPAFNAASTAALAAVDEVVIPLAIDAFSMSGVANILQQIINMREVNPRLRVAGLLITKYYDLMQDKVTELVNLRALPVYKTMIRDNRYYVAQSTFEGEPLPSYSPHCAAAIDYRRWVKEYLGEEASKNGQAV